LATIACPPCAAETQTLAFAIFPSAEGVILS
jgi:hypothetical protein